MRNEPGLRLICITRDIQLAIDPADANLPGNRPPSNRLVCPTDPDRRARPASTGRPDLQRRAGMQHGDAIGEAGTTCRSWVTSRIGMSRTTIQTGDIPSSGEPRSRDDRRRRTANLAENHGSRASARARATRWRWPPESNSQTAPPRGRKDAHGRAIARRHRSGEARRDATWQGVHCRAPGDAEQSA